MKDTSFIRSSLLAFSLLLSVPVCAQTVASHTSIRAALTFHASFDGQLDAEVAAGDPTLYTASSWDSRTEPTPGLPDGNLVTWAEGKGRYGDALWFDNYEDTILFFNAEQNIAYQANNWNGTISFWLSTAPDEDFKPGEWCDPIQITPRSWDDASLFVDFSRNDVPRIFRVAAFANTPIWNPDSTNWMEISNDDMPWIQVKQPPFGRDQWTHVVITFDHFNTGQPNGVLKAYLNGQPAGELGGLEQTLTWDPAQTIIRMGMQYVGYFDDFAFFNRALTADEIKTLYALENGIRSLNP